MARKYKLTELNPQWVATHGDPDGHQHHLRFDCPEGHKDCDHIIPFSPCLDGQPYKPTHGALWGRHGDNFETLTLTPSIRRIPRYKNREDAIKQGCRPEWLDTETLYCALHIFIKNGIIEFCPDSK